MTNLNLAYQSLPESIKEWLADENVALFVDEINSKLGIDILNPRAEIIPHLILRLCVQDLEPRDFINELSGWLGVSFESAKTLTKEIEERILKPIEAPLKIDVGVDLKLLYFASAKQVSGIGYQVSGKEEIKSIPETTNVAPITIEKLAETKSVESATTKIETLPVLISEVQKSINLESNPKPETWNPIPESHPKPFILHEEKEEVKITSPTFSAKPSFEYKVPLSQRPEPPKAPSRAQVELAQPTSASSFQNPIPDTRYPITRVVHYTKFFTKIFSKDNQIKQNNESKIKVPRSRWFV